MYAYISFWYFIIVADQRMGGLSLLPNIIAGATFVMLVFAGSLVLAFADVVFWEGNIYHKPGLKWSSAMSTLVAHAGMLDEVRERERDKETERERERERDWCLGGQHLPQARAQVELCYEHPGGARRYASLGERGGQGERGHGCWRKVVTKEGGRERKMRMGEGGKGRDGGIEREIGMAGKRGRKRKGERGGGVSSPRILTLLHSLLTSVFFSRQSTPALLPLFLPCTPLGSIPQACLGRSAEPC